MESFNPEDLWKWMQRYEDRTAGQVLAIAHNGNLSNGIMFPKVESFLRRGADKARAETRARWEPLYEATQIKGDGETHPFLSPDDEFADYETWDQGNLDLSTLKEDEMLQYEYARSALGLGMQLEQDLGVNPYKFGMIGATDSHTGLATADENNFFGKHSGYEPSAERYKHEFMRVGDAVLMLSRLESPPLRLLLGGDVLGATRAKLADFQASMDEWEAVTLDVGFPEDGGA